MARFFCIFHTLSFELNFVFDRRFPLKLVTKGVFLMWKGCLESCALYSLHQLSTKGHLVVSEG